MSDITIYPQNILEDGTVTVTGTPDTGYPEERLYDRALDLYWKDTATQAFTFHVDYGSAIEIDALFIDKHNFNSCAMQFQYSANDADWSDAVTDWTQGDNNQIAKVMGSSQTKRYWRVTVASMANPKCSEVFISLGYDFPILANPNPVRTHMANVQWNRTIGEHERSTKLGLKRRIRNYSLNLSAANQTNFDTVITLLDDYSKPFYIKDHDGDYFLCRLTDVPSFNLNHDGSRALIEINVIEML